ncbi:hypothetical protein ASG11_08075 [Sphingomonas sp. Leaf357]|uniref:hypothetical protein n=1 Tax=Sphingomonas sp. Leaf357 TaxID=1736350 RepID=UPI0006FB3536|nr:hypothetical protein [Sphingomonas sp. Leaf357]KQS04212.1 hypothetical protein ASG11_08075 [Sphingomonas sp. Leaf357]
MAAPWLVAAAIALAVAVLAGLGERRRKRRMDLDRVGLVDWPTVQMIAFVAVAIFGIIAWHA